MAISLGNMWHGVKHVRRQGEKLYEGPQAGLLWLSTISLSLGEERKTNLRTLRPACTARSKVLLCHQDGKSGLSAKSFPFFLFGHFVCRQSNPIKSSCNNPAFWSIFVQRLYQKKSFIIFCSTAPKLKGLYLRILVEKNQKWTNIVNIMWNIMWKAVLTSWCLCIRAQLIYWLANIISQYWSVTDL